MIKVQKIEIEGGQRLNGSVKLNGFKHSMVPIIASSLLTNKPVKIENIPKIKDAITLNLILNCIGVSSRLENHTLKIEAKDVELGDKLVTDLSSLVSSIHGSLYLLPSLLIRTKNVKMPYPGGCKIGTRPVVNIAYILRKFGAKVKFKNRMIEASLKNPKPTKIDLRFKYEKYVSGATKAAIIMGSALDGETVITHAYSAQEVVDLCNFLENIGVEIEGKGTKNVTIRGSENLNGCSYELMPDLIEMGTFIGAAAMTLGSIKIENVPQYSLDFFRKHLDLFMQMGIKISRNNGGLNVSCDERVKAIDVITRMHPYGISTDLQPIFSTIMSIAKGKGRVKETVWEKRFAHVSELRKMGAKMSLKKNELIINGVERLKGNEVEANDLRAAASLVLAGLNAQGKTTINRCSYLEHGYENFDGKLRALEANIIRVG